jgi:quercetin dioxygenase-like cupin family protein
MISGVEHGAKSPSISVLVALAEALGTSLSQLIDGGEPRAGSLLRLTKADQRIVTDPSGVSREHFEPGIEGSRLEFVRFVLPPGSTTNELAPHALGSLEHAHVSHGSVEIWAGTDHIAASAGDTVVFNADQGHGYRNTGRSEAAVYVVVEPRSGPNG